jgi:Uma2 family endonuclease
MTAPVKILPHYTYDEYCKWEGRWELIEGIPYAMSPAPMPRHQWVSANIKGELRDGLKKSGCKNCRVYDFIDIKITEDTVVQPDAVVVCGEINNPYLDFSPALVVEILSPSTAMKDRNNKFYLYQSFKVSYYIIIDTEKNTSEIYHLKEDGKYALETFIDNVYSFILEENCSIAVDFTKIWE